MRISKLRRYVRATSAATTTRSGIRRGARRWVAVAMFAVVGAGLIAAAAPAAASAPAPIPLSSSKCPVNIKEGQHSGCVTELQKLLNSDGARLTVDGDFGPATLAAVKSYQSRHALTNDGIVGPLTKAVLAATNLYAHGPLAINSSSCPTNISEGMRNGCVTQLQQLLNDNGAGLAVDGDFGPATLAAVKHYQSTHGLTVDGIVGPKTKAALVGPPVAPKQITVTSPSCPVDITEQEIDGCVTELQILLNKFGAGLTVDGDFGPATLAAVKHFQSTHGLAVDGIVGPNTKAALLGAGSSVPTPIPLTSSSCPTNIREGMRNGCVTELQELLNNHGAGLIVDGDFGPATLAAVKYYQSTHNLTADGIVGPHTKASLDGSGALGPIPVPPSGTVRAKIVSYAKAIENGAAEPGWSGGRIWYIWGGGHHGKPGPSTGTCVGDPVSWACNPSAHPQDPSAIGLDCSGFARWVYDLAYGRDVLGSGSTRNQIAEMRRVGSPVPGDLVFFGTSASNTHHVGVYIGNGQMINAFETGTQIRTDRVSAGGSLIGYYQY